MMDDRESAQLTTTLITCPRCGAVIGEWAGGAVIVRHQGREIVALAIISIRCDRCHAMWRPVAA
jgi:uncharacterized C2H2 Zn-finger protein